MTGGAGRLSNCRATPTVASGSKRRLAGDCQVRLALRVVEDREL